MYQYFLTFGRYYTPRPQLHVQDSSSWLCCSCQRSIHNSKYIFAEQQHLLVHHVHWRTFEARTQDMMIGLSLESVPHQDFASRKLSRLASFKGSVLTALLHCEVFLYHFTLTINKVCLLLKQNDWCLQKVSVFLWYDSHVWRLIVSKKWLVTHITLYPLINKLGPY